jgi:L-amino acid N-acyltransferase YncA
MGDTRRLARRYTDGDGGTPSALPIVRLPAGQGQRSGRLQPTGNSDQPVARDAWRTTETGYYGPYSRGVQISPMLSEHADEVLAIFQAGIDGGNATFETMAPAWEKFAAGKLPEHRFVALDAGRVLGWAALSPTSDRCVYLGVAEVSVYIRPGAQGRGVGRALLDALIESSESAGLWTLQAGIFPENTASMRLHEAAGFRLVGVRERIGRHEFDGDGRWRDVVLLERRSPAII